MSFRRIPFQFSSTDPVERQAELEKRFGLPSRNNMYVDVANPLSVGAGNMSSSSPRLQHRVPIFLEGHDQPVKTSVDSVGSSFDVKKKPNVRIIPIEIEGAESRPPARHRVFSGPAGLAQEKRENLPTKEDSSPLKRSIHDITQPSKVKAAAAPKVHNIPVKIEERDMHVKHPTKSEKISKSSNTKDHHKVNVSTVCNETKQTGTPEKNMKLQPEVELKIENSIDMSLKKIEDILKELVSYESGVKDFIGTAKDKQYRFLDEMLTRCMLRLDDIETMGNDNVRSARKAAVKKVQACIDLLDSKVNPENIAAKDVEGGNAKNLEVQAGSQPTDTDMEEFSETSKVNDENVCEKVSDVEMLESPCSAYEGQDETVSESNSLKARVFSAENSIAGCKDLNNAVKISDKSICDKVSDIEMSENPNDEFKSQDGTVTETSSHLKFKMPSFEETVANNKDMNNIEVTGSKQAGIQVNTFGTNEELDVEMTEVKNISVNDDNIKNVSKVGMDKNKIIESKNAELSIKISEADSSENNLQDVDMEDILESASDNMENSVKLNVKEISVSENNSGLTVNKECSKLNLDDASKTIESPVELVVTENCGTKNSNLSSADSSNTISEISVDVDTTVSNGKVSADQISTEL